MELLVLQKRKLIYFFDRYPVSSASVELRYGQLELIFRSITFFETGHSLRIYNLFLTRYLKMFYKATFLASKKLVATSTIMEQ